MFFILFVTYLLFGLVFYDLPYFQLFDEAFPLILFAFSLIKTKRIHKGLLIYFGIAAFYLAYSFIIGSNVLQAILFDFIVISKPFLTLFSVMVLKPKFTKKEQQIVRYIITAMIPVLVYAGLISNGETVEGQLLSGARLSFCCIYIGLAYYLFSKHGWHEVMVMSFLMAIGLFSPTSKSIATMLLIAALFALTTKKKFRLNFLNTVLAVLAISAGILLSINDIQLYFSDEAARGAMYLTSGRILVDFLPMGSGFASFGTPASATFYSHIYNDYSLDAIWGLGPDKPMFISDAFYPALAEFGFVGIVLFIVFFVYLFRFTGRKCTKPLYRIALIIPISILIESVSDVSFIGNRGEFAMMLLGYAIANIKNQENESTADK